MRLNPKNRHGKHIINIHGEREVGLLYTSDAADDLTDVEPAVRRIMNKKQQG